MLESIRNTEQLDKLICEKIYKVEYNKNISPCTNGSDLLYLIDYINKKDDLLTSIHFDDCGRVRVYICIRYDSIEVAQNAIIKTGNPGTAVCLAVLEAYGIGVIWEE